MLEGQYARGERERLLAENERLRSYLALIADGDTPRDSVDLHEAKELAREALAEQGAHEKERVNG